MSHLICVIDDEEMVRDAIALLIRSLGYDTAAFASAEDFLQSENALNAQCIITDLHMPGMSGAGLLNRLIERATAIPVIFVTGRGGDQSVHSGLIAAGAFAVLNKPFEVASLAECIKLALKAG